MKPKTFEATRRCLFGPLVRTTVILTAATAAFGLGCLLDRSGLQPPLPVALQQGCFEVWDAGVRTGAVLFETGDPYATAGRGRGAVPELVAAQGPWTFAQSSRSGNTLTLELTTSSPAADTTLQAQLTDSGSLSLSSSSFTAELPPCRDLVALFDPGMGLLSFWRAHFESPADLSLPFTPLGSDLLPLAGDWDGDGDDEPGVFSPAAGVFFLFTATDRLSITAPSLPAGDTLLPFAGDWDGDGRDSPGLYAADSALFVLLNEAGTEIAAFPQGRFDPAAPLGLWPTAGNWNGDPSGIDTVGLYNRSARRLRLFDANNATASVATCTFDTPPRNVAQGLLPVAGRWSAAAQDRVLLYGPGFAGGTPGNSLTLVNVPGDPAGCAIVDRISLGESPLTEGLLPIAGNWAGELVADGGGP